MRKWLIGTTTLAALVAAAVATADGPARTAAEEYRDLSGTLERQSTNREFSAAEKTCRRMIELAPRDPNARYNLACMLARQNRNAEAMAALADSVAHGFVDAAHIRDDPDLAGLHGDKAFDELVSKAATGRRVIRWGAPRIVPDSTNAIAPPARPWSRGSGKAPVQENPVTVLTLPSTTTGLSLRSVCFADAINGWIVGDRGLALATTDGGVTWTNLTLSSEAQLRCVMVDSAGTGWCCGDGFPTNTVGLPGLAHSLMGRPSIPGTLLHSENGGAAWRRYWMPTNFELPCVGWNGRAVIVGTSGGSDHPDGDIFAFQPPSQTAMTRLFRAVHAVAHLGGDRWVAVGSPVSVGFTPAPTSTLYTERRCRAVFSRDNGRNWMASKGSEAAAGKCLRGVAARTNGLAVAVGDKGDILTSSDAGETWAAVAHHETGDLLAVALGDAGTALAVGRKGLILASVDNGATWRRMDSRTQADLRAVSAAGNLFVAVGGSGVALRIAPGAGVSGVK